jgi:hypothetical protein
MKIISPIFILGIFCFILPVILNIFSLKLGNWTYTLGTLLIIIGVIHTLFINK